MIKNYFLRVYLIYLLVFIAGFLLYLVYPSVVDTNNFGRFYLDEVDSEYYIHLIVYLFFYQLGFVLVYFSSIHGESNIYFDSIYDLKWSVKSRIYALLFLLSVLFIVIAVFTRNIFSRGVGLFVILGYDILLCMYYLKRSDRGSKANIIFFISLFVLFLHAGFRYRIILLVLPELLVVFSTTKSVLHRFLMIAIGAVTVFLSLIYSQVRIYGGFSGITEINISEISLTKAYFGSGEQTVYLATRSIYDYIDYLSPVGFEPIAIALTHYIPSVFYPDKPRATYLSFYSYFNPDLKDTGSAMHDFAQALIMFGTDKLWFSSIILGSIAGYIFSIAIKRVNSHYYLYLIIVLFGFFLQTRGYFVQQLTWMLTFSLILFLLTKKCVGKK